MNSKSEWKTILVISIICFLNILSVKSFALSLFLCLFEYAIIYFYLINNKPEKSFLCYLIFLSVSMEMDFYIYPDGNPPFERFSLFNPNLLGYITPIIIYALLYNKYGKCNSKSLIVNKFIRLTKWLTVTGIVSIIIAMVINDNNIRSSGAYPELLISPLLAYLGLIATFYSAITIIDKYKNGEVVGEICKCTIIGISIATILSMLVGLNGYYDRDETMLAPLVSGLSPCVILFFDKKEKLFNLFYIFIFVLLVILAVELPSFIGSKWYLVLSFCLLVVLYSLMPKVNPIMLIILGVAFLYFIPFITEYVSDLISVNQFNSYKFEQVSKVLDITSYGSIEAWFLDQDPSAQFRIDEPINIAIEYINKPWFAPFGKGIAGTTQHYTIFCDWSSDAAFSAIQSKNGFYYDMHESTAVLFLRHGLLGIFFMVYILIYLIRSLKRTPFAAIGIIWFMFYWSFGASFRLGAVALIIALFSLNDSREEVSKWHQ